MTKIVSYHRFCRFVKQTHTAFVLMGDAISGAILYTKVSKAQILVRADALNNSIQIYDGLRRTFTFDHSLNKDSFFAQVFLYRRFKII